MRDAECLPKSTVGTWEIPEHKICFCSEFSWMSNTFFPPSQCFPTSQDARCSSATLRIARNGVIFFFFDVFTELCKRLQMKEIQMVEAQIHLTAV
jgi:hypothetical protein